MVQIDSKALLVFEQLLREKLERLAKGVNLTENSKNSSLYRSFNSDFYFYKSLYEDVCKILLSDS